MTHMHRGVGVKKLDLLREQAEIRVKHRQGSETQQVNSRGDPASSLRTQIWDINAVRLGRVPV